MERSKLGKTELLVGNISFGCMSLSKNDDNNTLIRSAYEGGINFFDTADRYDHGWNESILGNALKDFRDDVLISTKVGHQISGDGSQWVWKPTKDHILAAADQSLNRLQTDRIDLYQLHGGTLEDPMDEIIEAFEILQQAGKIRYYGISSIRPNVIREYVRRSSIASVMMQYSLADRRPEEECFGLLKDNEIGLLARGTLAKGVLIDKPPAEMLGYSESEVAKLQDELKKSGDALSASIHFVLGNPAVTTAVVGIRTQKQLDEILKAYHTPPVKSEIDRIAKILEPKLYEQHR
ncbi:MAG: aldo/keto reductase [Balneolaceae bacterium]|nr:MAG: aldo/keto reductase [Balneolaceae bacterium]